MIDKGKGFFNPLPIGFTTIEACVSATTVVVPKIFTMQSVALKILTIASFPNSLYLPQAAVAFKPTHTTLFCQSSD